MLKGLIKKENGKFTLCIPKIKCEDVVHSTVRRNNSSSGKVHISPDYINREVLVFILPRK